MSRVFGNYSRIEGNVVWPKEEDLKNVDYE